MGFRRQWEVLGIVLLWTVVATANDKDPQIVVMVNNTVRVAAPVLYHAEVQAGAILLEAGIEVVWVNCGDLAEPDHCRTSPGQNEFVLHLVPTGATSNDLVFGEAFLDEDGMGKYSDIFFDRVDSLCRQSNTDIARLLGSIAAHELGHLILGSHSHSAFGIMQPLWTGESLRRIAEGALIFLPQESKTMRRRIGGDQLVLASKTNRSASALPAATAVEGRRLRPRGFLP